MCRNLFKRIDNIDLMKELGVRRIITMRILHILEIISGCFVVIIVVALVGTIDSNHANILIRIISVIRIYSRKKKPGAAGSDWSSSNKTVNYLSYSRHAGFVESWKTHVTCFIRANRDAQRRSPCHLGFLL